eukprot:gene4406-6677_t
MAVSIALSRGWQVVGLRLAAMLYKFHPIHHMVTLPPKHPPRAALEKLYRLHQLKRLDLGKYCEKHAAVLVPLCLNEEGKPCVLFTLRSEQLNRHKGEVSFPGGMIDDDEDEVGAAVRECVEEIGVEPQEILGVWHDVTGRDRTICVTPVIGFLGTVTQNDIKPSTSEVADTFMVPCMQLFDPSLRSTWSAGVFGMLPQFDSGPYRIWGVTAYILAGVFNTVLLPYETY